MEEIYGDRRKILRKLKREKETMDEALRIEKEIRRKLKREGKFGGNSREKENFGENLREGNFGGNIRCEKEILEET